MLVLMDFIIFQCDWNRIITVSYIVKYLKTSYIRINELQSIQQKNIHEWFKSVVFVFNEIQQKRIQDKKNKSGAISSLRVNDF